MTMKKEEALLAYTLRLGDNALIIAQRLIELVAHGPELEEEMANANFALDYLGQARMFYSYAGELEGKGRKEDEFAFMRDEREFCSFLLSEQPNGNFGDTIARSVMFDVFYLMQLEALVKCTDERLAGIAARAVKEIRYHQRHNSLWLIRLGDGTDESHEKAQNAISDLWRFTGELFAGDEIDDVVRDEFNGPDLERIRTAWQSSIAAILATATLQMPEDQWMDKGGRTGRHSEHFGPLIAEMQYMQRSYPGLDW
jgi:ring-1,2-phenylacetyl-CoA epoxidase subunit PaaC